MTEPRQSRGGQSRAGRDHLGRFTLPVFLMASILYLEIILRARADSPFINVGLLYVSLFAGVAALVTYLFSSFFIGVSRSVVTAVTLGVITLLFLTQLIYYDIFKTFYTVFSATNGGQVAEFTNDVLLKLRENIVWVFLLFAPLILFALLMKITNQSQRHFTWLERGVATGLTALFFSLALLGINLGDKEQNSAYRMYYSSGQPVSSVNQLGLMTSMRLDAQRTVLGFEPELPPPVLALPKPEKNRPGEAVEEDASESPSAGTVGGSDPVDEPVVYEENVMDIDFEKLMAEADGEELSNMHQYFGSRAATAKNEHTGMFEDYNLIFITAEGYSHYAVDEDLTPTLYKLTHEGLNFTDFYNPIWGVSTSDGEYVATTGLIPKSGVWSMYKSGSNSMPFAMGNQLQNLGYKTVAYHNHTFDYYHRDVSHPNLGYDYKGVGNGLEVRETWPESDIEMIDVTTPEFVHDEPFHAYYMTVSGHLQYNFFGNFIAAKNQDLTQDLPYLEAGRAYLATQIELDRALHLLLERLEEGGVADNTLIVMSGDHYPYGLEKNEIDDLAGHEVESNFELYKSSLIIYAGGMDPQVIDRPVSSMDILPTISNLMGLDYDSRLLMGTDVFSDSDPLVVFNNRSFVTDKGRYNSVTQEFTPNDGGEVPDDYRRLISDEIDRQFYYSAMVLDKDYYSIVMDR